MAMILVPRLVLQYLWRYAVIQVVNPGQIIIRCRILVANPE